MEDFLFPLLKDFLNYLNEINSTQKNGLSNNKQLILDYFDHKNNQSLDIKKYLITSLINIYKDNENMLNPLCCFCTDEDIEVCSSRNNLKYIPNKKIFLCEKHLYDEKNVFLEKINPDSFFQSEIFFGKKKFPEDEYIKLN